MHVSFSWAGALGETSYWSGRVAPVMNRPGMPPSVVLSDTPTVTMPVLTETATVGIRQRRAIKRQLSGPWRRH